MSNKLGTKHTCNHCHQKFYDLQKMPVVCPYCDKEYKPLHTSATSHAKKKPPRVHQHKEEEARGSVGGDMFFSDADELDVDIAEEIYFEHDNDTDDDMPRLH